MNRHDRRRAAALARQAGRRTGYIHRLLTARDAIVAAAPGKLVHLICHHDPRCGIYTPRRSCTCVPEMPVAIYSHMFATVNLLNLLKFLTLRCDPHAQYEIREYADALLALARAIVPVCISAWESNDRLRTARHA
jgi:hypothetical protein